ncbi:MAG: hypothetical protein IJJ33_19025 [Victivallales bacterium]|nr:hypothetical protein [Victivallales bacterium]
MKLKDIRFNLRFSKGKDKNGEEQFDIIRSLQELKDNLNIDELYLYFVSGQLARWLTCIGEPARGEAIGGIDRKSPVKEQLEGIFKALGIELSKSDLASMVESYTYFRQLEDRKREMATILNNVQDAIEQDYMQYSQCLKDIIEAKDDFALVKSRVRAMLKNYPSQFKLDWMRFYDVMMEKCRLAIFAVLMDPAYRKYYLGAANEMNARYYGELEPPADDSGNSQRTTPVSQFMQRVGNILSVSYERYCDQKLRITMDGRWALDVNSWKGRGIIKEVDYGKSGGEWEDALDRGTRIMILHCGNNITIRPSGDKERQFKGNQGGRFPIFNGLDFRTSSASPNSTDDLLLYMEVK